MRTRPAGASKARAPSKRENRKCSSLFSQPFYRDFQPTLQANLPNSLGRGPSNEGRAILFLRILVEASVYSLKPPRLVDLMVFASSLFALYIIIGVALSWYGIASLPLASPVSSFLTLLVAADVAIVNLYLLYRRGRARVTT